MRLSRRIRDKYETELTEMETTEKQTRDKYSQTKAQLIELQGNSFDFRYSISLISFQENTID